MKITLITGAASGLGKEFANIYAKESNNLFLVDIDEQSLYQVKAELEKEAEKRKFDEMFDTRKKVVETEPVPEKSQLVYERGRYQHDPEYEMRLKALESPIGFEIGK